MNKTMAYNMFNTDLFMVIINWKQTNGPTVEECLINLWHIHSMEYSAAIKKKNHSLAVLLIWLEKSPDTPRL